MAHSKTIGKLAAALAKVQGALTHAVKGNVNPAFRSKYADLASVWEACRKQLADNEVAVIQSLHTPPDGWVAVETLLAHSSGEWSSSLVTLPVSAKTAHGYGSAITYARRYGLAASVGVYQDDDDANAAVGANGHEVSHASAKPITKGATAEQIVKAMEAPPAASGAVEELYEKAAILGGYRSQSAQDIVTAFSEYKGKAIESPDHARRYLTTKPDGKWIGMTTRKIEDEIGKHAAPAASEIPEWAQ